MKRSILIMVGALSLAVGQAACAQTSSAESTRALAAPGEFASVGNHRVTGGVLVETRTDGLYLVLNDDFESQTGPDLRVLLRDRQNPSQMLVVEPLQAPRGRQEYKLALRPEELRAFNQVSIYCAKFHVDFGVADLP